MFEMAKLVVVPATASKVAKCDVEDALMPANAHSGDEVAALVMP